MLSEFGVVDGIEPSAEGAGIARQKAETYARVTQGAFPNALPKDGGLFDLICLFDFLEYIDKDFEFLKSAYSVTKQSGKVLISVPARLCRPLLRPGQKRKNGNGGRRSGSASQRGDEGLIPNGEAIAESVQLAIWAFTALCGDPSVAAVPPPMQ